MSHYVPGQKVVDKLGDITDYELKTKTYGEAPNEPLLGNYSSLPQRPEQIDPILLDDSLPIVSYLQFAKYFFDLIDIEQICTTLLFCY